MSQQNPKMVRRREGRMIGGVAVGIADNLNIDITIVRLALVALTFVNGLGALIYLILWIIMPDEEHMDSATGDMVRANVDDIAAQAQNIGQQVSEGLRGQGTNRRGQVLVGAVLMGAGVLFILQRLNIHLFDVSLGRVFWPLVLIGLGVALLSRRARGV